MRRLFKALQIAIVFFSVIMLLRISYMLRMPKTKQQKDLKTANKKIER